jgi:predicted transcriptional regulator
MVIKTPLDIRQARKRVGISQAELALTLGVSQSQISDLERGLRGPKSCRKLKTVVAAIAKAAAIKERIETAKRDAIEQVMSDFENRKIPADDNR